MPRRNPYLLAAITLFALLVPYQIDAADACDPVVGRIVAVEGRIELLRAGSPRWRAAELNDVLCEGDTVRSGAKSRTALVLDNEAVLRLDQLTTLRLVHIVAEEEEQSILDHLKGLFAVFSRQPRKMTINAAYLNGAVEGTEFVMRAEERRSSITVLDGRVRASNDLGSVDVSQGEAATGEAGKPPVLRTVVQPRDAVQWAVYYPPILAFLGGAGVGDRSDLPTYLLSAARRAAAGDIGGAYAELEGVAQDRRDSDFHLYRAALDLSVGRVDEARADIRRALRLDPDAGLAHSLRSIAEIVRNEPEAALVSARRGLELGDTAAARIALSYAQQANLRIGKARETLEVAVEEHSEDPLAWARLGELWLMSGNSRKARAAAREATERAPGLARGHLVMGYAALAELNNMEALNAFERAIELRSADPLAHLGAGLARIGNGDLEAGRRDLEVAVGLDANTSLIRAYLGKAYFEEKRHPLAARQYGIAKQLDPNDPTAYLYDGLLKQTINRPIDAVDSLQKSIELNDNRAVYRSRLLLDRDRAARGTSLARAYNDLGFTQLGVNEATKSLALDPSNASAHRFLSDTYLDTPRREIARVSELLQAQLMQDVNINPVQPSLSDTNLNIIALGGPAKAGFNEFTPLFALNETQINTSGIAGGNDTYGGEAVASGVHDRISYSVGGFTYDTDGWRANNDLEQNLYNVYLQGAVTPEVNLQGEFQHRDSNEGDLALQFDPADIGLNKRRKTNRDTARLGFRYSPQPSSPRSTFLFSYIHTDADEDFRDSDRLDPLTSISIDQELNTEGGMLEGQYIYQSEGFNLVSGAAYSDLDTVIDENVQVVDARFGPVFSEDARIEERIEHPRGYAYVNVHTGQESVDWTIGASYDDFTDEPIQETSFNPKFGVRWQAGSALAVRGAAFQVVKPSFVNNRTIEPTQVAGFNQFFDDLPGTESRRYGVAVDWRRPGDRIWGGAELTWRDLDEPTKVVSETGAETARFDEQSEQLHRLYLYWTPTDRLAANAAFVYDRYEGRGLNVESGARPEDIKTLSLPLSLTYFHPNGVFTSLGGTYVDQTVRRIQGSRFADGEDDFLVVDAALGYRLPRRRGIVSLAVKNLFDKEFMYQDNSFRAFSEEAVTSPFIPDRTIVGRLTLSF